MHCNAMHRRRDRCYALASPVAVQSRWLHLGGPLGQMLTPFGLERQPCLSLSPIHTRWGEKGQFIREQESHRQATRLVIALASVLTCLMKPCSEEHRGC